MSGIGAERLLELALGASPALEEAELLRADGALAGELERLRADLALTACALASATEPAPAEGERLARAVLARTTRRRGLVLLRGRIAERWPESLALRVLAASLLVHLAALPVLGWYALRARPEEPRITFDLPRAEPPAPEAQARPPVAESVDALAYVRGGDLPALAPGEAENARRRARFLLHSAGAPPDLAADGADVGARGRLVARHARLLAGDSSAVVAEDVPAGDAVAAALAVDLALDRALLEERPVGLDPLLRLLDPRAPGAAGELHRAVARRALAYGWVRAERIATWGPDGLGALDGARAGDPLRPELGALVRAAAGADRDPALERWCDWLERPR